MSKEFPSISVVMPLYYKEKPEYLDVSLGSLYRQTYQANEIVLIKEGILNEEHYKVLKKWEALFPSEVLKIIDAKDQKGLSACLNFGINASHSDYIARFDSDDECLPERFEKQVNFIKRNPDVAILGGQIEEYDQDLNKPLGLRRVPTEYSAIKRVIKFRCPFNHQTVIYKRDVVLKLGGYPLFGNSEDYALWGLFIANHYKVANMEEILVKARTGEDLFNRRSGYLFLSNELKAIKFLYKIRILNFPNYVLVATYRSIIRLLPVKLVAFIYGLIRNHTRY
jgi:glycosyltransferase involved in cell wall biosynthesis